MNRIDLQLTLLQSDLKCYDVLSTRPLLQWKRQPFAITPPSQKRRNKSVRCYFDQNHAVLIRNVTQSYAKTYVITNKVQNFDF